MNIHVPGMIEKAIAIANDAHLHRHDDGGAPYILHPLAVALRLEEFGEEAITVALLHDVVEDHHEEGYTFEFLTQKGFPNSVIEALRLVTRDKSAPQTYMDWIQTIADSRNRLAVLVKLADLEHNMSPARVAKLPEKKKDIVKRYQRAKAILLAAWSEIP